MIYKHHHQQLILISSFFFLRLFCTYGRVESLSCLHLNFITFVHIMSLWVNFFCKWFFFGGGKSLGFFFKLTQGKRRQLKNLTKTTLPIFWFSPVWVLKKRNFYNSKQGSFFKFMLRILFRGWKKRPIKSSKRSCKTFFRWPRKWGRLGGMYTRLQKFNFFKFITLKAKLVGLSNAFNVNELFTLQQRRFISRQDFLKLYRTLYVNKNLKVKGLNLEFFAANGFVTTPTLRLLLNKSLTSYLVDISTNVLRHLQQTRPIHWYFSSKKVLRAHTYIKFLKKDVYNFTNTSVSLLTLEIFLISAQICYSVFQVRLFLSWGFIRVNGSVRYTSSSLNPGDVVQLPQTPTTRLYFDRCLRQQKFFLKFLKKRNYLSWKNRHRVWVNRKHFVTKKLLRWKPKGWLLDFYSEFFSNSFCIFPKQLSLVANINSDFRYSALLKLYAWRFKA